MSGSPNLQQLPKPNPCSEILLHDAKNVFAKFKDFDYSYADDHYGMRDRYLKAVNPHYGRRYDGPENDIGWFLTVLRQDDRITDARDATKFLHGAKFAFSQILKLLEQSQAAMEEHLSEVENPALDEQVVKIQKQIDQWKSYVTTS